ncbi:Glyceraldehyde-3-phosphate dehydrogenase [Hondaea fermentalgiana]|uniref:Glyceraldehyde-3-phosphate dehydrogenase n=1 Tax=Hondaea fermentalgiana TaxID=2315210 RepID=A0A2R5GCT2_9STRA|nr:Glyceraldehyde-3-phosphate dehydrogenase [Hondaea fermentalgiana]|eukprot:GBG28780.1 Glyceraldehyde-3-phosphate dehydrogenase [Hondaea fermentalgiana]
MNGNGVIANGDVPVSKRSWAMAKRASCYESELEAHNRRERCAVRMAMFVGELLYERGVELVLFRKHLSDASTAELLGFHAYAAEVVKKPIDIESTTQMAEALTQIDLAPAKLDVGLLAYQWKTEANGMTKLEFLQDRLATFTKAHEIPFKPRDVVLFGFGRIGRLAARELIRQAGKGQQLRLRAIVTRDKKPEDIVKRAALLSHDSVHGNFKGIVEYDIESQTLCVNGQVIQMISAAQPEDIDYVKYGIDNALIIDNTGAFRDFDALSRHHKSEGVNKILLTAPGKGVPNVVYGINHEQLNVKDDHIFSAASCTTNAISPVLKVIDDVFGVRSGHIETCHSYTNDQSLLDNFHKKERRGRSAALNMVLTETGAAKAVPRVIPTLEGKLTAHAIRVPTPNASLAILQLRLNRNVDVAEVNEAVRQASVSGDLVNQIHYSIDPELVSNDVIGNSCCAVFDSVASIQGAEPDTVMLYVFYDNEFGYTRQVMRLAKHITGVRRKIYY